MESIFDRDQQPSSPRHYFAERYKIKFNDSILTRDLDRALRIYYAISVFSIITRIQKLWELLLRLIT